MVVADVTVAGVAGGVVGRGATLDATKIGLTGAQSASTIETRRTTGDLSRRCARAAMGRKASDRSGRRTTEGRTTSTEAWRKTSEHRRRTRWRAELSERGSWRGDDRTEQHARGEGEKSSYRHYVFPSN
jgi:hypothetical protein